MSHEVYAHRRPPSEGATIAPQQARLNELCAQVLCTPQGRELMDLLRKVTIEKRSLPMAPEPWLREQEARRGFFFDLENWRDAGIAAMSKPKESAG